MRHLPEGALCKNSWKEAEVRELKLDTDSDDCDKATCGEQHGAQNCESAAECLRQGKKV